MGLTSSPVQRRQTGASTLFRAGLKAPVRCPLPWLFVLGLVFATSGAAQEVTSADEPTPRASAGLEGRITSISGTWTTMVGGFAQLHLPGSIAVGGAGFAMANSIEVTSGDPLDLVFGYGGLTLSGPISPATRWTALLGAGNIDLMLPGLGVEILSSNAFVGELGVGYLPSLDFPVSFEIHGGFRFVAPGDKLDDLPLEPLGGLFFSGKLRLP